MTSLRIVGLGEHLTGAGEALLPVVPARSRQLLDRLLRAGAVPPAVQVDLSYLHLAALVCLYGSMPNDLHLSPLLSHHGTAFPGPQIYLMCASDHPGSLEWLEAARAGLDHWSEAGFEDPLHEIEEQVGATSSVFRSYETLLQHNLNRLKVHGCFDRYLRLKRHAFRPPVS